MDKYDYVKQVLQAMGVKYIPMDFDWETMLVYIKEMTDERKELRRRVEHLTQVVKPFVEVAAEIRPSVSDSEVIYGRNEKELTAGDFRRIKEAVERKNKVGQKERKSQSEKENIE